MKIKVKKYRKSLRPQQRRGVPKDDPRWVKLFKFMGENEFTMEDFLACVCANFTRYPHSYYETQLNILEKTFNIRIVKGSVFSD